jgi:hypothetical protein
MQVGESEDDLFREGEAKKRHDVLTRAFILLCFFLNKEEKQW